MLKGRIRRQGDWVLVARHDASNRRFFTSANVRDVGNPRDELFSILDHLDELKPADEKFQFRLLYPLDHPNQKNEWRQTSNPTSGPVSGYEPISISWTSNFWGGLELNTTGGTSFLDGSVNSGNWYYAVGSYLSLFGPDRFPGPGTGVRVMELWMYSPAKGPRVLQEGIELSNVNEVSAQRYRVELTGVHTRDNTYSEMLVNQTDHAPQIIAANGVYFATFNADMTLQQGQRYDTTIEVGRTAFANRLNALTNEPFAMVTVCDSSTDSTLDAAFANLKSTQWRTSAELTRGALPFRYCAFGRGGIGITNESFEWVDEDLMQPYAALTATFESVDEIGASGYGPELQVIDMQPSDTAEMDINPVSGQHLIVNAMMELPASESGSTGVINVIFNQDSTELSRTAINFNTIGVPEKKERYILIPDNTNKVIVSRNLGTDTEVHFVTAQLASITVPTNKARTSQFATSVNRLSYSPISAHPSHPEEYQKLRRSSSNLYQNFNMTSVAGTTRFASLDLTSNQERSIIDSSSDYTQTFDWSQIDPSGIYYCSAWVYDSTTGTDNQLSFRVSARDSSNQAVSLLNASDGTANASAVFQSPTGADIPKDKWFLMEGWILPSSWDRSTVTSFLNRNVNFFGNRDTSGLNNKNNGFGISNTGNGGGMFQFTSTVDEIQLSLFIDKGVNDLDIQLAFPVLTRVSSASLDQYNLYSQNIENTE